MSEILINIKIVKISEHAQKSLKKFARAKVESDYKGDF